MINILPPELIETIINHLKYSEVGNVLRINKYLSSLTHILEYRQLINYEKIKHLDYSDNFANLICITEKGEIDMK